MINKVNGLSFRSLYFAPNEKFTDAQLRSVNNIKLQMAEELSKNDYYVTPTEDENYVKLYNSQKRECIGSFDEYHQFNKNLPKNNLHALFVLGMIALGAISVCYISNFKKIYNKHIAPKTELVKPAVQDSIKSLKDTLNLVK